MRIDPASAVPIEAPRLVTAFCTPPASSATVAIKTFMTELSSAIRN